MIALTMEEAVAHELQPQASVLLVHVVVLREAVARRDAPVVAGAAWRRRFSFIVIVIVIVCITALLVVVVVARDCFPGLLPRC